MPAPCRVRSAGEMAAHTLVEELAGGLGRAERLVHRARDAIIQIAPGVAEGDRERAGIVVPDDAVDERGSKAASTHSEAASAATNRPFPALRRPESISRRNESAGRPVRGRVERFIFGVPLIARAAAADWALVDAMLSLTLASVRAQSDAVFEVLLAAHEPPPAWAAMAGDPRFTLVRADWPAAAPSLANDDGGRKKHLITEAVRRRGGGLLMFLDADDWVDRDLVRIARAAIAADMVGGVVADGWAVDWRTGAARRFPMPDLYDGPFADLCGSSTIGRIDPASPDPIRRDPHAALGWHGEWVRHAASLGAKLASVPVIGGYLVGTGASHSERDGPHAAWRQAFSVGVARTGAPLRSDEFDRLGLSPAMFAAARASVRSGVCRSDIALRGEMD